MPCLNFSVSWLASVPLAIGLALARRSTRVFLKWPAATLIEVVRGVPLVTLLFMAAFMLPALLPQAHPLPLVWRATLALTLFSSVYPMPPQNCRQVSGTVRFRRPALSLAIAATRRAISSSAKVARNAILSSARRAAHHGRSSGVRR